MQRTGGFFISGFRRLLLAGLAVAASLAVTACAPQPAIDAGRDDDPPATAQQTMFRDGVPHTDRQGRLRRDFDAQASFLPIGIYHAIHGAAHGYPHDLSQFSQAGYNTVHLWPLQDQEAAIQAAGRLGLQVVVQQPDIDLARRHRNDPAILAWMLADEPSVHANGDALAPALADFEARVAAFRQFDPQRAILTVDGPGLHPLYYDAWVSWLRHSDIQAQFNYPFLWRRHPVLDIERVGRVVARAVRLTEARKPIWYIAQAFEHPGYGWYMPDIAALRATVYAALVHGASGVIFFGYDSYGTRADHVRGISPAPWQSYGGSYRVRDAAVPLLADPAQLAQSRALWQGVAALNHELAALAPSLLRPTAALACDLAVDGPHKLPQPVRFLIKQTGLEKEVLLLAVNQEAVPLRLIYRCDAPLAAVSPYLPASGGDMTLAATGALHDALPPFGVRLYRLRLQ